MSQELDADVLVMFVVDTCCGQASELVEESVRSFDLGATTGDSKSFFHWKRRRYVYEFLKGSYDERIRQNKIMRLRA